MNQTVPGTVKDTGASKHDILMGVEPEANAGLVIEVLEIQSMGEGGRIKGAFKVLAPGSGRYAKGISDVLQQQKFFNDAASFLHKVQSMPGCSTATHIVNANALRRADPAETASARQEFE
jgi:hypothetical protein